MWRYTMAGGWGNVSGARGYHRLGRRRRHDRWLRDERRTLTPFDRYRLESRLEALCEKGCRRVWQDIDALERGEDLPETRGLGAEERRLLLRELKQVMAVYADRCSAS